MDSNTTHPFFQMVLGLDSELRNHLQKNMTEEKKEKLEAEIEQIKNNPEDQETLEKHILNCWFEKESKE